MTLNNPFTKVPDEIYLAGDWHANTRWVVSLLDALPEGVCIVQLGDFGVWRQHQNYLDDVNGAAEERNQQIVFVDGNHEDFKYMSDSYPINTEGLRPIRDRITHLPRGYRWDWHGYELLALGGAYSIDRNHRRLGVSYFEEETITYQEGLSVIEGGHADVMFTHDVPFGLTLPGVPHPSTWHPEHLKASHGHQKLLRGIVDEVRPSFLFHGHMHTSYQAVLEGIGYETQVRGLDCDGSLFNKHVTKLLPEDLAL